ncbi:MAG: ATP-binding protein [Thermoanaerobaculia bacterium]|nr:ATP-binding protein [Thermoanaerobaculia bacterium]
MKASGTLRRLLSRLWIRLLAFNVLLVFVPVVGFFLLDVYERQLLAAQERSMVQQGRILAAALSERGELRDVEAQEILRRLEGRVTARIRVLDANGELLADSSVLVPNGEEESSGDPGEEERGTRESEDVRENLLYRIGSGLYRVWNRLAGRPTGRDDPEPLDASSLRELPAVQAAQAGRYGASTRLSPGQRSVTLYSGIPIRSGDGVAGVVLVAQSTLSILQDLYDIRLEAFKVFLGSLAVAAILSLLVSMTIVRPVARLRREAAALLDRRGRLRGRFRGSDREDEIGELSRALEELSRRLETHLEFIESFAADVSHEFKNPLASIRNAAEMLADSESPEDRERFLDMVQSEIARMEHLLAAVREITVIDTELEEEPRRRGDLSELLRSVIEGARIRSRGRVQLEADLEERVRISGAPERLTQVFENLLSNAVSFSPPGGTVRVELLSTDGEAVVHVDDQGPGVPAEHRSRIFDRFFSFRPRSEKGDRHSGLGLAIARAIVEGHEGTLTVGEAPAPEGGARFTVRLPRDPET